MILVSVLYLAYEEMVPIRCYLLLVQSASVFVAFNPSFSTILSYIKGDIV